MEFHGDGGSIAMASWLKGDAPVSMGHTGKELEHVPLIRPPDLSVVWSRGVGELAHAIAEDRPNRGNGEHGAHLVDVMNAIEESSRTEQPVEVTSSFPSLPPMEWAT